MANAIPAKRKESTKTRQRVRAYDKSAKTNKRQNKIASNKTTTTKKTESSQNTKKIGANDFIPEEERIPYTRKIGDHLHVVGKVNGIRTKMLVDTGAFKVTIGSKELKQLGIELPKGKKEIVGYGAGGANYGWYKNLTISVGKIKRTLKVNVVEGSEMLLLGQPFLRGMHYKIDRKSNYIHFTKSSTVAKKQTSIDAIEIPFRMVDGNMITVVTINGRNVEVNFDTGAPYCLFSTIDAKRLGLKPVSGVAKTKVTGIGGKSTPAYVFDIESIHMGPIRKRNIRVFVTGIHSRYPVLGQSFFGHTKFVVDNEKNIIRFER